MTNPSNNSRLYSCGVRRCVLVLACVALVAFLVRLFIFWHSRDDSYAQATCHSCDCSCQFGNIFPIPPDCGKNDPDMNEELKKDMRTLMAEELNLWKNVTDDNLKRSNALIMGTKKTCSLFRKEAEKCIAGMETCEQAREKAAVALVEERRLSELWEKRAHEHGWKDETRVYSQT